MQKLHRTLLLLAGSLAAAAAGMGAVTLRAASQTPVRHATRPQSQEKAVRSGPGIRPAAARSAQSQDIVQLTGTWQRDYTLSPSRAVEITVHLERPSALPPNGRVAVEWERQGETAPPIAGQSPSSGWRKVLHALDHDISLIYQAPVAGTYRLRLSPVTDEIPIGDASPRWREKGDAPALMPLPRHTPWPTGTVAPVAVTVQPVALGTIAEQAARRTVVAVEPNDSPEQAQPITLTAGEDVQTWEVLGGADDAEYFDNGKVGKSGEDWFRLDYRGSEPRLLTAQLSLPNQLVLARIRAYAAAPSRNASSADVPGAMPLVEYREGMDQNERTHQQDEQHRANICRTLQPGKSCYLRVEANAPGYQLQLRVLRPAPYRDPRMAVRQAMYTQIGQVDAWLTNRPRGASVERRIRDSGNLLGTQCMSCHTQSGVWGPAVPIAYGYRVENVQNFWHLINVMYECLRPTNQLVEAANNTSLAPLDIGDGPAGTRAAGFNIVNLERVVAPRKLHAKQQIRTANFVLQTGDPGGINAAGPGSNIGQVVVYLFAAEILRRTWEQTGDPRYFRALEQRAQRVLEVTPKFTDDLALRVDFFNRVFPLREYAGWARKAAAEQPAGGAQALPQPVMGRGKRAKSLPPSASAPRSPEEIQAFVEKAKLQVAQDEARLRAIQNPDGSWGFNPGQSPDGGKTWQRGDSGADPAPTALGITALTALGNGAGEPAVAKAVQALLGMQDPSGRWNRAAQTGFVTTAYALHALARLYPITPTRLKRANFLAQPGETLPAALQRVQALALAADPACVDLLLAAAGHRNTLVRWWAMIGLGATHTAQGVPALLTGLGDRTRRVREAAVWGLRQTLLDDRGWAETFAAFDRGSDDVREGILQALNMRADAVLPQASLDWSRLTGLLDRAMNQDPHPAVRAWAAKAAWQWWVWNPPVRQALNAAWIRLLERPESNALAENSGRYAAEMLFIANGHRANGSGEHQYKELADLVTALTKRLEAAPPDIRQRLAVRLVSIGATYYALAGGDGGPGQMGYATPGSGELLGKAVLIYLEAAARDGSERAMKAGIEGAANVPYQPLTAYLVNYSLKGPESLRQLAASAISDPRSVSLAAVPELVEPQLVQVRRGAMEPPRRPQVSDPILNLWSRVNWNIPKLEEQQKAFFDLIIPRFERFQSPQEVAALNDPARRAEAERGMDADWYLADRLGEVLEMNPDLHQEIVFRRYFPASFRNPLEERYWVRSVEWILTFDPPRTEKAAADRHLILVSQTAPKPTPPDPALAIKDRALQLYLDQLRPTADPKTRDIAVRMANKTALRRNPEVLRALALLLESRRLTGELLKVAQNVLSQSEEKFQPDLRAALQAERHPTVRFSPQGEPELTAAQKRDILYFRDYVIPELTRQKRSDQQSCMGCHGQPGRVPSMQLVAPDTFGYMPVTDLLKNYRILQQRVQLGDLEKSKILRKPLNIQDGKEDGHQGGRRYSPGDEGYLMLRRWVEAQPEVQRK